MKDLILGKSLTCHCKFTLRKFLDCSNPAIRDIAFNMQRSVFRYWVKKRKPIRNKENQVISNVITNFSSQLPLMTAKVSENDGMSVSLIILLWVLNQHFSKSLFDSRSLIELLSKRFVCRIKAWPAIQKDGHIRVSLANNSVTILDKYVIILINVEGVEAVIKAWLVNIEVYDLLFDIT